MMTRTIKLKLPVNETDKEVLLRTVEQYRWAYNYVARIGWEAETYNGVELHHLTYHTVRNRTDLPAQLVVSARMVASESLKSVLRRKQKGEKVSCPEAKNPAIRFDQRSSSVKFEGEEAVLSFTTTEGRKKFQMKIPGYFLRYLAWKPVGGFLKYNKRRKRFYFHVIVEKPEPIVPRTDFVLGVDLGLRNLAVASTPDGSVNRFFDGGKIRTLSEGYASLRRRLQVKGTPSAKRHLRELSGREKRFRACVNHKIAKEIVDLCLPGGVIVLEKLTGIRGRARMRKKNRRWFHSWNFAQLQRYIEYKAQEKGISVVYLDARYSSQKCSRCGYRIRSNRKDQVHFECRKCGYRLNADLNAARNLANNYPVKLSGGSSFDSGSSSGTGSGMSLPVGRSSPGLMRGTS